jgi:hypothetical protein
MSTPAVESVLAFPYPVPEVGAEDYWQAANDERLVMQKCDACAKLRFTPAPICTHCGDDQFTWAELSGKGKIITWTVITHPIHPAAVAKVPYVVVVVELDEQPGLRMVSNLIDVEVGEDGSAPTITFDAAVSVAFEPHPSGQKLPVFRLV